MARLLKTMSHTTISTLWIILWIFAHGAKTIDSFIPATTFDRSTILRSSANSSQSLTTREIKDELKAMDVSFADCFDKESLLQRLHEARENSDIGGNTKPEGVNDDRDDEKQHENQSEEARPARTAIAIDLEEIRAMRVRELREELASRSIRWAGLLEKEDLVQAVYEARKKAAIFSATGTIAPGEVGELTGEQLEAEMMKTSPPLLLDAYATWCGPCKMMEPQLKEVAKDLAERCRVAKMDTDKYPQQAGSLRVKGLPTLILFSDGKEIDRLEGALMKEQLLDWINSRIK